MSVVARHSVFVKMFSSAVLSQALLSAASLGLGLVLIRHASDAQYGYYMLVVNAFLLLTALENAFVGPPMVIHLARSAAEAHPRLIGGAYREQRGAVLLLAAVFMLGTLALWAVGALARLPALVLLCAVPAGLAVLEREYFRIVLLAYKQAARVLRTDLAYVLVIVAGAALAILTPLPVVAVIAMTGAAALVTATLLRRELRRRLAWQARPAGVLRAFAPTGLWSVAGAGIHWVFSQSYGYLVAAMLDIRAVAALGATRLLLMPVNLLSTGIRSQMMPVTTAWLQRHGASRVLARLAAFALAMALVCLAYFAVMWLLRDWLFTQVLKKHFAGRDTLLALWSAIFLLMVIRDQLIYLPIARERFRALTGLTLACALLSTGLSWFFMLRYGLVGALLGMLCAEAANLLGITVLCWREARTPVLERDAPLGAMAGG